MIDARTLCSDADLAYLGSRTVFEPGDGMTLDATYRLAHLPLIAPDHPRLIASKPDTPYRMGRHPRVFSLVLPIPTELLGRSDAYGSLSDALRRSPVGPKIAWDIVERRRDRLHATICGSLSVDAAPLIEDVARRSLAAVGPVTVELRGLFSGNVNRGRLYLRAYPERRDGRNMFHELQRAVDRPTTDLYVVGIWNLADDLTPPEAEALSGLIDRWWDRPIVRFEADHLWLLGACDDLVLDSEVVETVRLHPALA